MIDWSGIAGGRCPGRPWRIGVAGFAFKGQSVFLLSDADWARLSASMPLEPLQQYGQGNGLLFERLASADTPGLDGVLLFVPGRSDQPLVELDAGIRRYLVLTGPNQREWIAEPDRFARLFVPAKLPPYAEQTLYLNPHVLRDEAANDPSGWPIARAANDRDHSRHFSRSADFLVHRITSAIADDAASQRNSRPLLSVVIPTYNYGRFLHQCVTSVLEQGLDDIEILVLDNASSDQTPEVMRAFATDRRVRYMRNRYNYGPGFNWGNGLMVASGHYVTFLSADDYLKPGHLPRLLDVLQAHPEVAVGYTGIEWVDAEGQPLRQPRHPGYRDGDYVGGRNEVADLLIHDNYLAPSAVIFRRRALRQTWQPVPNGGGGDWDMAIQMAARFPDFAYLDEPGVCYRWHGAQHSQQSFYASSAPLRDHLAILEGVFERDAQDRLADREAEVARHLQRRLALYPKERNTGLGTRALAMIDRLHVLAEENAAPLFSVVVTTWNRPALLADALDSLQAQTCTDFEVVLVNDCGPPVEHLLEGRRFPVTYLRRGRNQGPAACRNAAHALARGRYLVYLDDDDLFLPDHLQVLAAAIATAPDAVVYSDAVFVSERVEDGRRVAIAEERRYLHDAWSPQQLAVDNYIPINTFAWPRALAARVGGFDERLAALEDWEFLLRLAAHARFVHVPRETVQVRMRVSGDVRRSDQALADYPALYREIYARHPDQGEEQVRAGRAAQLKRLGIPVVAEALEGWRAARLPTSRQRQLALAALPGASGLGTVGVLLLDRHGDQAAVLRTLRSLHDGEGLSPPMAVRLLRGPHAPHPVSAEDGNTGDGGPVVERVALAWPEGQADAVLAQATAGWDVDWLIVVEAGAEFSAGGRHRLALALAEAAPDLRALYADAWYRDPEGALAPVMRPDPDIDLLRGNPAMMAGHWLFSRRAMEAAGGFDPAAAGAVELDLVLRLVQQGGMAGIVHLPEPLLTCAPPVIDPPAQRAALLRHLQSCGYGSASVADAGPGLYRVDYGHDHSPAVSIAVVISADTALAALERCVVSILEHSSYQRYELLLLDNGARAEPGQWLDQVEALAGGKVRAFRLDPPLPHAAACNLAASQAAGEFLLFLRPDVAVVQADWLQALLNHGLRPEVGVVGAKAVDGEGRVTHAGLFPGLLASGGRAFAGLAMDAPGYMGRAQVTHRCTAVSDACLLVRRDLFIELDGFDHAAFPEAGADVDLCLRVAAHGNRVLCTPQALLLHQAPVLPWPEPAQDALLERWLPAIAHDPAYNPNLRLDVPGGFRLGESDFSWRPLPVGILPRILAQPADPWGSGHYRVIQPFQALRDAGLAEGALYATLLDPVELARIDPDVVVMQRRVSEEEIARMRRMRRFSRAFAVYELDDWLPNLPLKSAHRADLPADIVRSLRAALAQVDRLVVATPALAEALAGYHARIRVVQNRLEPGLWGGLPSAPARPEGGRPRVGWAGGVSHDGDLEMIADVVRELAGEVDWVFFGMCPERLRPYVREFHPGVDFHAYPRALALLGLDLALAPLEDNAFNRCKSHLRLLEYGACGYPVVCSDLEPYRGDLPVTRVRNRYKDWVGAIRQHLAERQATAAAGQALRQAVRRDWMLQGPALEEWRSAWLPD
ncbi:glycosyltransferase [Pseudoxanthomonas sp.]|uniref:glycosyltransferase n=1 Tax=Pseudoxanthomonas sp. TaxID=1871049 RepID=UPI00258A3191|nr:glycosyltransferase [Pseudoxanthomonas sp.]